MIEWKHVIIAIIILLLLQSSTSITHFAAETVSAFMEAMRLAWQEGIRGGHAFRGGAQTYALAKVVVLGIIAVAIAKLIKRR